MKRFLPLLAIPIMAIVVFQQVNGVPAFVRGVVDGASVTFLVAYCLFAGTRVGSTQQRADRRRLGDLDPLGDLPHSDGDR